MEQLYHDCPLRELLSVVLETYFRGKKPFILGFENLKKNIKMSKMAQVDTNKELIQDNYKEFVHFLAYAKGLEDGKTIAASLCKLIEPCSRSMVGPDLVNLFKVIDRYSLTDEVRQLLINVAPNLMTIESLKIYDYSTTGLIGKEDAEFSRVNQHLEK